MRPPQSPGFQGPKTTPANAVADLTRHGLTNSTLQTAKSCGLREKDLVDLFNQFGPTSLLVCNVIFEKVQNKQPDQPAPTPKPDEPSA